MFIDTHAHLDLSKEPVSEQVEQASRAGVAFIVQSGIDLESSRLAVDIASAFPGVFATVGVHPHEAMGADAATYSALAGIADHPKVIGIGETGLDFYRNRSPRDRQEEVFRTELEVARELGLPVVIHTRQADDRTIPILDTYAAGLNVILHCFSMPERVFEFAERGWYMSFAGNVTFKKAEALRTAVRQVPSHLLLIETDAPFLTPEPLRGRQNTPANVVRTYEFVALLRGVSVDGLAQQVLENAARAFPKLAQYVSSAGTS